MRKLDRGEEGELTRSCTQFDYRVTDFLAGRPCLALTRSSTSSQGELQYVLPPGLHRIPNKFWELAAKTFLDLEEAGVTVRHGLLPDASFPALTFQGWGDFDTQEHTAHQEADLEAPCKPSKEEHPTRNGSISIQVLNY